MRKKQKIKSKRKYKTKSERRKIKSKRRKSKRRKSKSKRKSRLQNMLGGFPGDPILLIDDNSLSYIKRLLDNSKEVCGYFKDIDGKLQIDGLTYEGENDNCRHYRGYQKYMWHIHPKGSKYYLSTKDIINVLSHENWIYSYVFTIYGYWILYYDDKCEYNPLLGKKSCVELGICEELIEEINNEFYFSSGNGRVYNKAGIDKYIDLINNLQPCLYLRWYDY